jgi:hypothetical protein
MAYSLTVLVRDREQKGINEINLIRQGIHRRAEEW